MRVTTQRPRTRDLYRAYVENLVTRTNTVTGVVYRDDPTIFAWELANEANAEFDDLATDGTLLDWYDEMATYVRSIDPNHIVATGEEGFDVPAQSDLYSDAYTNDYVLHGVAGTSYVDNTSLADIAFGGAHLYPDAWGFADAAADGNRWIVDHAAIAHDAGKPFVLGEFGNPDRSVYEEWLETAEAEGVAGTLLWQLEPESRGRPNDMAVVYPVDAELVQVLREHASRMNAK